MDVGYYLVNKTKKEKISYLHLKVDTAKELAGNPVSSAITTWYLIKNGGDEIGFIPDQYYEENRPYKDITWEEISTFKDLTNDIVNELIEMKILTDHGIEILDENEPDLYTRRLKNIWD